MDKPGRAEAVTDRATDGAALSSQPYTAVIHFHGIGQQRHYESVSQLVEGLHGWIWRCHQVGQPVFGVYDFHGLWRLKVKREPVRTESEKTQEGSRIVYIRAEAPAAPGQTGRRRVRFYEAYWAPATVEGATARGVALWAFKQALRPLQMLLAPWDQYHAIREVDLVRRRHALKLAGAGNSDLQEIDQLAKAYRAFVYCRNKNGRSYKNFRDNLDESLRRSSKLWHVSFVLKQWKYLLLTMVAILSIGSALGLLVMVLLALLTLAPFTAVTALLPSLTDKLEPNLANAVALVPIALSLIGVQKFLREQVGDVQQFVSYQEIDPLYERRRGVMKAVLSQLEHVLSDAACERAIIVAHSLGTAVAMDALRELAERNIAYDDEDAFKGPVPLHKIEHFVTVGSPIDKINYFFFAMTSTVPLFVRLVYKLRGDLASYPFSKSGGQPHIHWVNYWDRGDPISGPLESVVGEALGRHDVDNVQVVNLIFPHSSRSHTEYFKNERVLADVFWMAFCRHYSFVAPARTIVAEDIYDVCGLIEQLRKTDGSAPNAPAIRKVWSCMSESTRAAISELTTPVKKVPPDVLCGLVTDLNGLICGPVWLDSDACAEMRDLLRKKTQELLQERPTTGYKVSFLNRLLLEDSFGHTITKRPRLKWLGPGTGSWAQNVLLHLQLIVPFALIGAFVQALLEGGNQGFWILGALLAILVIGSGIERVMRDRSLLH